MSHIVTVQTQVRDPVAIRSACTRLKLAAPAFGEAKLFSGAKTGWIVQLVDWRYSGGLRCEHREGRVRQLQRPLG